MNVERVCYLVSDIRRLVSVRQENNKQRQGRFSDEQLHLISILMDVVDAALPYYAANKSSLYRSAGQLPKTLAAASGAAKKITVTEMRFEIAEVMLTPLDIAKKASGGNILEMQADLLMGKRIIDAILGLEKEIDDADFAQSLKKLRSAIDRALQTTREDKSFNYQSVKEELRRVCQEIEKKISSWKKPIIPHPLLGHVIRAVCNKVIEKLTTQLRAMSAEYKKLYQETHWLKQIKLSKENVALLRNKIDVKRQVRELIQEIEALREENARLQGKTYRNPFTV